MTRVTAMIISWSVSAKLNRLPIVVLMVLAPSTMSRAQNKVPCPPTPLTEKQILDQVAAGVPPNRTEQFISSCHVAFSIDPASLERLAAAGTAPSVLDAWDRDTISRMTLAAAHAEVTVLEARRSENVASLGAERDSALRKQDADYQAARDKASYVPPPDMFTPKATQTAREQAARDNVAALDRRHEADRAQLLRRFADDLDRKNQPMTRRISALMSGRYPVPEAAPRFVTNDPDARRLTASINGVEYLFTAAPDRAKILYEHWSAVGIKQSYQDAELRTPYLVDTATGDVYVGASKVEIEQQHREAEAAAAAETNRRRRELVGIAVRPGIKQQQFHRF